MKKIAAEISKLNQFFGEREMLSLDELRNYFKKDSPGIAEATIRWRVHDLVQSSVLHRSGHGLYELGSGKLYSSEVSPIVLKISKWIKKQFPGVSFCCWGNDLINEFAQHISAYPFILVDVERDVAESVYFALNKNYKGVFFRPSQHLIDDLLPNFKLPIITRYLVSEAPVNEYKGVPQVTLEKILVDVFCDMEFSFLAGSERTHVFRNAYSKYTINESKLLRYAARKGRKDELRNYINAGGFNNERF